MRLFLEKRVLRPADDLLPEDCLFEEIPCEFPKTRVQVSSLGHREAVCSCDLDADRRTIKDQKQCKQDAAATNISKMKNMTLRDHDYFEEPIVKSALESRAKKALPLLPTRQAMEIYRRRQMARIQRRREQHTNICYQEEAMEHFERGVVQYGPYTPLFSQEINF
ncbi:Protein CBG26261 [Caenorhabditis briggsae]|uniref:Protein CBG26261 n=1 Tax=Caenorhabditis briggsae TaxID=6238 RepID=B6IKY7_CAEBR|nr:Protein CBG26261 [Caenorhabditis briggsae]CAS00567.1 Protein CBG26261 [Caenorhabditis briggsae]